MQIRASKSDVEISKAAIEGLADGLKELAGSTPGGQASLKSFQVCLADAIFILVGCTPQNEGIEVLPQPPRSALQLPPLFLCPPPPHLPLPPSFLDRV